MIQLIYMIEFFSIFERTEPKNSFHSHGQYERTHCTLPTIHPGLCQFFNVKRLTAIPLHTGLGQSPSVAL